MTNSDALKDAIRNSGLKMKFISDKLGITAATFSRKINGKNEFNASEITTLKRLLGLSSEQRDSIFFNDG